jgi:hypothetical protein
LQYVFCDKIIGAVSKRDVIRVRSQRGDANIYGNLNK